ncbi:uncharacterized protein MELLADRAFT_73934 [Melampsora larici-populina 98AG31]|uniref:Uncharacterized protein n=1 Tax=Melampsora larici-populina (strain 98AG31 / pathotype 3-4-7) TaxID=747676 RepID=F4R6V6_MELLP|nr:uncharacterized protein MELLADRAFT_73934 [Melampsora larici-populina 98AG31]EGG11938.1 hypothetical protein MELLADRAFT_73934 [Melampsora larici-populina 98AG31]
MQHSINPLQSSPSSRHVSTRSPIVTHNASHPYHTFTGASNGPGNGASRSPEIDIHRGRWPGHHVGAGQPYNIITEERRRGSSGNGSDGDLPGSLLGLNFNLTLGAGS